MPSRSTQVAMTAELHAPKDFLPQDLQELVPNLASIVAHSVDQYVRTSGLGYYPALAFFRDHSSDVNPDAVEALFEAATEAQRYVETLVLHRLSAPFADVQCDHSVAVALSLPRIRPSQTDALPALIHHYQPGLIRLHLMTRTMVRRDGCCMASNARERAIRWLNGCCCGNITQSRSI